jgi:RNA polymerase sigma factor (sigma-70 family)
VPNDSETESAAPLPQPRDTLPGAAFPTTQWSLVLRTQRDEAQAAAALDELCRRYWYPIYAYLRRRGLQRSDAEDTTQGFFLKALAGGLIASADQEKGRLRSYLLAAVERHLTDERRREHAVKRGGRAIVLPLECLHAEERFAREPADQNDPEKLFLAAWARSLLDQARDRVRLHYIKTNRLKIFEALQSFLSSDDEALPYRELAHQLDCSETALRLQVFRLRQRFAECVREEVAATVRNPDELEEELTWLAKTLNSSASAGIS